MRAKLIVNDIHLGVARASGTTDTTAKALRAYLLAQFRAFIMQHLDKDLVINGDIFDQFNVPMSDVLEFYQIISDWIKASNGGKVWLGMGNHDFAKDSSKMSSLEFVGRVLEGQFPFAVGLVMAPQKLTEDIYMVPHVANQDIFNLELERAAKIDVRFILLHANFDNHFAIEADHSLNVSGQQALTLFNAGKILIFGHEHQARHIPNVGVLCTGNQWPSSIADCLGNPDGRKAAFVIQADGQLIAQTTWSTAGTFVEMDWKQIADTPADAQFVRVVGDATVEQAADVISIISKFRQKSTAFVVKNSVAIEGVSDMQDLPEAMEMTKQFDVLTYLFEQLDPKQIDAVKLLLAQRELNTEVTA